MLQKKKKRTKFEISEAYNQRFVYLLLMSWIQCGFMLYNSSRTQLKKAPPSRSWHHLKHVWGHHSREKNSENDMLQLELLKWLHQMAKGLENSLSACPGRKRRLDMSERQYLYYYNVGKENETKWWAFRLEPCTQQAVNNWQLLVFLLYVN